MAYSPTTVRSALRTYERSVSNMRRAESAFGGLGSATQDQLNKFIAKRLAPVIRQGLLRSYETTDIMTRSGALRMAISRTVVSIKGARVVYSIPRDVSAKTREYANSLNAGFQRGRTSVPPRRFYRLSQKDEQRVKKMVVTLTKRFIRMKMGEK